MSTTSQMAAPPAMIGWRSVPAVAAAVSGEGGRDDEGGDEEVHPPELSPAQRPRVVPSNSSRPPALRWRHRDAG